jgi:signal transduction histidine kinase
VLDSFDALSDRHQHADELLARLRGRARADRDRAALEGQTVVFDYSDDGAGMDADMLAKLFDPFFTTKRGSGGSGLGAHILFNLVTGPLGGTVRAESEPGRGLRYHLRFPCSRRKEKPAA